MHRLGKALLLIGALLVAVGMAFGFWFLLTDADNPALSLLGLVPLGFIGLLAGTVMTLFSRPEQRNPSSDEPG